MTLSQAMARAAFRRPVIRDFAGELIIPSDEAFEPARRVQNDAVDRRPAVIARCTGPADVASAMFWSKRIGTSSCRIATSRIDPSQRRPPCG